MKPEVELGKAFQNSLSRKVFGIEMAKQAQPFTDRALLPPLHIACHCDLGFKDYKIPDNSTQALKTDEEFERLSTHAINTTKPSNPNDLENYHLIEIMYAKFLISDADIRGRLFASSPEFQKYIHSSLMDFQRNSQLSPHFPMLLEGIATGDEEVFNFIRGGLQELSDLSHAFSLLDLYNMPQQQPLTEAVQAILDVAFNTQDQSPLRRFILQYPGAALNTVSYIGRYKNPNPRLLNNFDPKSQYDRLVALAGAAREEEYPLMNDYLFCTTPDKMDPKIVGELDKDILEGRLDRVKAVIDLGYKVFTDPPLYSEFNLKPVIEFYGRARFIDNCARLFIAGQLNEQDLSEMAQHFTDLRTALISLPFVLASYIPWEDLVFVKTRDGKYYYDFEDLTPDSQFFDQPDLFVRMISAGLRPSEDLRSKVAGKEHYLDAIGKFTQTFAPVAEVARLVDSVGEIINAWSLRYLDDQSIDLLAVPRAISDIRAAEYKFYQVLGNSVYGEKVQNELRMTNFFNRFYTSPSLLEDVDSVVSLLSQGIFPTDRLIGFINDQGVEGLDELKRLKKETEEGRFDAKNMIQKDLEFLNYVARRSLFIDKIYEEWVNFEVADENIEALSPIEQREADTAAYEAAKLYWVIKERIDRGKKMIVIGNQRYGDLFIVQPLERWLQEFNLLERKIAYVHSGGGAGAAPKLFSEEGTEAFIQSLISVGPDVLVADGTSTIGSDDLPRMPSALLGYLNWFLAFNEACGYMSESFKKYQKELQRYTDYQDLVKFIAQRQPSQPYEISFWIPSPRDKVKIGNSVTTTYKTPGYDKPQAILASPMINGMTYPSFPNELKPHEAGYFDDPERKKEVNNVLVLTNRGIQEKNYRRSEPQFVKLVQDRMELVMEDMIRRTNPTG